MVAALLAHFRIEFFLSQFSDHLSERLIELREIGPAPGLNTKTIRQALTEAIDG